MARELPYFKFYTGEWANGSIVLEDYEVQGVFINVCCYYWSKQGDVPAKHLLKKYPKELTTVLLEENIVKIVDEKVVIDFLDEQMEDNRLVSEKNRINGLKSAKARKDKAKQKANDRSTTVQRPHNETSTINRIEKNRIEKNRIEDINKRESSFRLSAKQFLNDYDKGMIDAFCDYWTEPNKTRTKMRFEMQKTFDIKRRLNTWSNNNFGNKKEKPSNEDLLNPKIW